MARDRGSYSRGVPVFFLPPPPRVAVPMQVPVRLPPAPAVLPRPARVAPVGGGVVVGVGPPPLSAPDFVARVLGMSVKEPMDSAGRMLVDSHPTAYRGSFSRPVLLDPCWTRGLARLLARPESVRVEHYSVFSQPDARHAQLWCSSWAGL